jgi:hypothetical protein
MSLYERAKELGLTLIDRWAEGRPHHHMSEKIMDFLQDHDFHDHQDYFQWKSGGDGDNGEQLMFELDTFFEAQEQGGDPIKDFDATKATEVIIEEWIRGAESELRQAEKQRSDFSGIANAWGGHLAVLPDTVRFYDVPEVIKGLKFQHGLQEEDK